jgi:hypothetical protein
MATRRIFWVFCINRFGIGPLHCISSHSDFDYEFAEIFVIVKRLPDYPSRGVDKIAYRYKCFHTFKSINGVAASPTRRVGESFFDYEYLREFEAKIGTAR